MSDLDAERVQRRAEHGRIGLGHADVAGDGQGVEAVQQAVLATEDVFLVMREIRRELDLYLRTHDRKHLAQVDRFLMKLVVGYPSKAEELRTIRRGFHTLKGSGRMVGLTRLGEVAWAVEQVMNKAL